MMKDAILYTTDLHGEIHAYERILTMAEDKNVKAVIIGGDITPFLTAIGDVALYQREFINHYLIPRLTEFKRSVKKPVFIIMGNDDLKVNEPMMKKADRDGAFDLVNRRVVKLGNKFIAGYTYVNETPFLLKDWERTEDKIKSDLRRMAKLADPRKTIYVMHAPPLNTNLDVIFSGRHVGSAAIRDFIEEAQPCLTLHGHIHESYDMTGSYKHMLGKTLSVNPGKHRILAFSLNDISKMKVIDI